MVLEALASQGLVQILEGQQALLQERRGRSASSEDGAKSRDLSLCFRAVGSCSSHITSLGLFSNQLRRIINPQQSRNRYEFPFPFRVTCALGPVRPTFRANNLRIFKSLHNLLIIHSFLYSFHLRANTCLGPALEIQVQLFGAVSFLADPSTAWPCFHPSIYSST